MQVGDLVKYDAEDGDTLGIGIITKTERTPFSLHCWVLWNFGDIIHHSSYALTKLDTLENK